MTSSSFFIFSILLLCFSVRTLSSSSHPQNFTFELIHRDSPRSPLYNPLDTVTDRFNAAYNRSISRSHRFNHKTPSDIKSGLTSAPGEFLMSITIGTPPIKFLAIADTGSDLTWVQCEPCPHCYEHKNPLFDTKKSSTYKNETCESRHCRALYTHARGCDESNNVCEFSYAYGDNSFSKGYLANETISILTASGSPVSFPGTVFGCSHNNGGTFEEVGSGIVGLGGGELSIVSQLSSTFSQKFSYCLSHKSLLNKDAKSVINIGANSIPSGSNVISTPFVYKETKTHYYLTLEAITVGNTKIPYTTGKTNEKSSGNIKIDSGASFTLLESGFFKRFIEVVIESVKKRATLLRGPYGTYCFKARTVAIDLPKITMHFNGIDVKLNQFNAFTEVSKGLFCLSMIPPTGVANPVFGHYAQLDFLVGYDLQKKMISFQPKDCSAS